LADYAHIPTTYGENPGRKLESIVLISLVTPVMNAGCMKLGRLGKGLVVSPLLLVLSGICGSMAHAGVLPSADELIHKAVERAQQCQARAGQTGYSYTKVSVIEELDSAGKVKERKEKVYQVSLRDGASYVKLVEVNGRAPQGAELKKQSENDGSFRQLLGESKNSKGSNRDNFLTPELVARYEFKVLHQTEVNGRLAYEIAFHPKNPEPPVHRMIDRLLNRISGTIWLDAEEFEVARAQFQLASEVDFLGGVLGSLKKLAFTVTRTRVADGLWLNSVSSGDFEGRKLLDSMRIKMSSRVSNFRAFSLNG
jgi:hypothetical protein